MNRTNNLIATFLLAILIVSCSEDNPSNPSDPSGETSLTENVDREFLKQIKGMSDIFAKNEIWNGYSYGSFRQYVIYISNSQPQRAYLVNPGSTVSGATKLGENENQGANAWRYDGKMQEAYDLLFGSNGNQAYDFNFQIDGQGYYIQVYKDEDILQGGEGINLTTHENFHDYQNSWTEVPNAVQDVPNFPVTKELLELQILGAEIFKGLPNAPTDQAELRKLLEQYVAIRTKELELDPSPGKLVRNMELAQEQGEGSAKYIEVMSHRQYFNSNAQLMQFTLLDLPPTTKAEVQDNVSFNILYNTGGSAIYILDVLGANIEDMQNGKTPYDIAVAFLNMTQSEMDAALAEAKNHPKWGDIQTAAQTWANL